MKTQMNAHPCRENNNFNNDPKSAPRLSDQAFYLIALAKLLKKESGMTSLEQFLTPGGSTGHKGKTAV